MTNSFNYFIESADYTRTLEDSYTDLNASFDRAEKLERENDARREANAAMPLELVKSLIEFSPKMKELSDKLAYDRFNKNTNKGSGLEPGTEAHTNYKEFIDQINDQEQLNQSIKGEAFKRGDIRTLNTIAKDGVDQKRLKDVSFNNYLLSAENRFTTFFTSKYKSGTTDLAHASDVFDKWINTEKEKLIAAGFNKNYIEFFGRKTFNEIKSRFLTTEQPKILAKKLKSENEVTTNQIYNVQKTENPTAALYALAETNKGMHNNNLGDSLRFHLKEMIGLVKTGDMPVTVPENILYSLVKAKGDKERLLLEKLGGSDSANREINSMLIELENAETANLDRIEKGYTNYNKSFEIGIKQEETRMGRAMDKGEFAQYVKDNWDYGQGGGVLPQSVKTRLSSESSDDILQKGVLDGRLNKGLSITQEQVDKLNDVDLREEYTALVKTGNQKKPSKEFADIAEGFIKTYANTRTSETDGNKDKSERWNSIYTQAPKWYGIYYEEEIATASSAAQAHLNALKRVKDNIMAGDFDALPNVDEQSNLTRRVNLIKAERHIKTIDPNIINTGIIFGTEEIIKEAAKLPKGETHLFYQQLADKLPGVHADDLQYAQLQLAHKEFGTDKPVKSDIQLALEKLPESVREKLTFHPSPARVARAKIDAYGSDNDITYNEIEFLLDEVSDFYATPEGQALLDAQFPVEDEVVIEPDRNIVTAGNRTRQRPEGEVPFIETEQFKNVMSTLGSYLPELGFGGETRDALTQDIAKAIEKRKKEVEKQNRQNRR